MRPRRNADVRARQAGREGDWARIELEAARSGDVVTWLEAKLQQDRPSKGGSWAWDSISFRIGWAAMLGDPAAGAAFPPARRKQPHFWGPPLRRVPRSGGKDRRITPRPPAFINKNCYSAGGEQGWALVSNGGGTYIEDDSPARIESETSAGAPFHSDEDAWSAVFEEACQGSGAGLSALIWLKQDSTDVGEGNPFWYDVWTSGEEGWPRLQTTAYGSLLYENAVRLGLAGRQPWDDDHFATKAVLDPMIAEAYLVEKWFWNGVLSVPAPYTALAAAKLRHDALPWNPPQLPTGDFPTNDPD